MRILFIATLCGAATCCAAAGTAVTAGRASSLQYRDFLGSYDLADGRTLAIIYRGHQLWAEFDGGTGVEIVADGPAMFIARDGRFRLTFVQHANGSVSGVSVTP